MKLDERLRAAGGMKRRDASSRRKRGGVEIVNMEARGENVSRKKKARPAVQTGSSDKNEVDLIVEQMKTRSGVEFKQIEIEQRRLEFERDLEDWLQLQLV